MKYLKPIIIVIVVLIIIVSVMAFTSESQEDITKKKDIDDLFVIWTNVAGSGDQQTLAQNEVAIKKDLFAKLNSQEVISLKSYSAALQNLLSVKTHPFNPLFISSVAYLTQNFNTAKTIINKTSASALFEKIGLGSVPKVV